MIEDFDSKDTDIIGRHHDVDLIKLTWGVLINGQKDALLIEMRRAIFKRAELGCFSGLLKFAQVEVLLRER